MHGAGAWDPESRGGQAPSQVKDPALGETVLDLWVHRFIELKGLPPWKSWARPYLLPKKVRPQRDTRTHLLPLGS